MKTHTWRHRWGFDSPPPNVVTSCGRRKPRSALADQAHGRSRGTCLTCERVDRAEQWSVFESFLFWEVHVPGHLAEHREWFKHVWGIERSADVERRVKLRVAL